MCYNKREREAGRYLKRNTWRCLLRNLMGNIFTGEIFGDPGKQRGESLWSLVNLWGSVTLGIIN